MDNHILDSSKGFLTEATEQLAISGEATIQQSIVKLIKLARREILIVLPQMHRLWDDSDISQGLVDFIRYSAKRDVCILMNSLDVQAEHAHHLVRLSKKVSSRIQLKQVSTLLEKPVMSTDYLMIIDQQHILRINDIERFSAWFDVNCAARAQKYAGSFFLQWPRAREITEYRQFVL